MSIPETVPRPIATESVPWTEWSEVPRFAIRYRHLSRAAMGDGYLVGVAIEELPPGKQSSPAHYHLFEEEHVFILEGQVTLRLGDGRHSMKAGDYACFPAGQKAGHCLINEVDNVCRYVIIGERRSDEVAVYTDSNKVLVRALGRRALFDLGATRNYWDGEATGLVGGALPEKGSPQVTITDDTVPVPPISSDAVDWDERQHGKGFVDRNKHLTYAATGREDHHVGVLIESPPPGMRMAPKHYHMLNEEHALILEGEVTLLFGDERFEMTAGDYIAFPAGQTIGHSFLNSGTGPCRYLMIGENNPSDVCVMPDSNKMQVRGLRIQRSIFDMAAVRDYLDGENAID